MPLAPPPSNLLSLKNFYTGPHKNRYFNISCIMFLFLIFFSSNAESNELHLVINGKSFHTSDQRKHNYNEKNFGLGFQYDFNEFDKNIVTFINAGGFSDSNENPSYYIGGGLAHRSKFINGWGSYRIDAGLSAFIMSRVKLDEYYNEDKTIIPGILPMLSIGARQAAINIAYIPETEVTKGSLWFIQLKINLSRIKF